MIVLMSSDDFKSKQLQHSRVREAHQEKKAYLDHLFTNKNLNVKELRIYLRAFKTEGILEVWAANASEKKYRLLTEFRICQSSGSIGPKRKEGDLQVPEGFYKINHFNPQSNFHLSLGIDYPNSSDKVFSDKKHPGSAIYIHGSCVTIGCLPLTDDKIKELYLIAVEARNSGQTNVPVHLFPMRMTNENMDRIKRGNIQNNTANLWDDLKKGFDYFEQHRVVPQIKFLANGRHRIF
jgi:murein L,D-transpeptidase YafK